MTLTDQAVDVGAFSFNPDPVHHTETMQAILTLRLAQIGRLAGIAGRLRGPDASQVVNLLERLPELEDSGRRRLVRDAYFHASFTGLVAALRGADAPAAHRHLERLLAAALPAAAALGVGPLILHAGPRGTLGFGACDPRLDVGGDCTELTVRSAGDGVLHWTAANDRRGTYQVPEVPAGVALDGGDERLQPMLEELARDPASFSTECVRPVAATGELVDRFQGAMDRLATCWPAMYGEICANVGLAVPISAERTAAFSNTAWQGAIFLRDDFSDPLFLTERIVHESSHLRLNAVMVRTQMHEHRWDERVTSPFRSGPRPITGLLHGAFVFTRAALALVHTTAGTSDEERGAAQALTLTNKVASALEVLSSAVRLTEPGRKLVAEIGQVCAELQAAHGHIAPAPESTYLQGEM
jgi:HEXXH motif-containing protein